MSDFRFSPRPNRAHEIAWLPWDAQTFARAAAEDRPILLSISAVWCHWCHVMDETTYSDPSVIETINRRFIPVRVDNDRRPDINARYNMGGWPTTAFLTPDGRTLTGATYLPPTQMQRALGEIARFYDERKNEIAELPAIARSQDALRESAAAANLTDAPVTRLLANLESNYDEEFGGFGDEPKFPQPEVLEFLLSEWRVSGNQRYYAMVAQTMRAMSRGGMYDHVEGGFFRYSTTRDWSVPHFEKMAEDHAGLLRVLATLSIFAPTDDVHATLISATNYVRDVLLDSQTGFFGGSQDADEAYFALPLEERRRLIAPFVDRTSYTNWTCALAGAFFQVAHALDDDEVLARAITTLDNVAERLVGADGLVYHVLAPGGEPEVRGLLTDHVAYLRALLDAHEVSGEERFLERARALAQTTIEAFEAPGGGFYDRLTGGESFGNLAYPDRPIVENGLLADALLRLDALAAQSAHRERVAQTLAIYAGTAGNAGSFAATFARALRRYLSPEVVVRIVGDAKETGDFREVARRLPTPFTSIRTLSPHEAAAQALPAEPHPAAYVCVGTVCGAPVRRASELRAAYDSLPT
ncbi:MAG TPA: DUF255 domain-containing protein [Candidatus Cybelea sp.]|nr:DUF255 domain-containing protein [Candidatus Cybelea sp.]